MPSTSPDRPRDPGCCSERRRRRSRSRGPRRLRRRGASALVEGEPRGGPLSYIPRVVDFSFGMEQPHVRDRVSRPTSRPPGRRGAVWRQTATSSLLADWQRDGEQPPAAGRCRRSSTRLAPVSRSSRSLGLRSWRWARSTTVWPVRKGSPTRHRPAGGRRTSGFGARRSSLTGRGKHRSSTTQLPSSSCCSVFESEPDSSFVAQADRTCGLLLFDAVRPRQNQSGIGMRRQGRSFVKSRRRRSVSSSLLRDKLQGHGCGVVSEHAIDGRRAVLPVLGAVSGIESARRSASRSPMSSTATPASRSATRMRARRESSTCPNQPVSRRCQVRT